MAEKTDQAGPAGQSGPVIGPAGQDPQDPESLSPVAVEGSMEGAVEGAVVGTVVGTVVGSMEGSVCPGCLGPASMVLPCGHRLCAACVDLCQGELGQEGCTVCYGRDLLDCVLNRLLDSLFQGQPRRTGGPGAGGGAGAGDSGRCRVHGRRFRLFCTEDEELLCDECQREEHEDHECCPLEEASRDCKRELRSALRPLQDKLASLNTALHTWQKTAQHIKNQAELAEHVAREEFEKLHHFLREEEANLLSSLKEEEEGKSQRTKDRIERITEDIAGLTDAIRETEEAMATEDTLFLKNFKRISERAQVTVEDPEEVSGSLLGLAQLLGGVRYRAWEKMQGVVQYTPVSLDPNTADACVTVSNSLSSVRRREDEGEEDQQHLPDNPERFRYHECVLGSEAYSSGSHSWDVEVGDNSGWSLGVALDSVQRKEWSPPSPEKGLWVICFSGGQYRACTPTGTPLTLKRKPQKVRVQLDQDRGKLTFSDASDNSLIYAFKQRFTRKVFPYLSTSCRRHPLTISAGRITVTVE